MKFLRLLFSYLVLFQFWPDEFSRFKLRFQGVNNRVWRFTVPLYDVQSFFFFHVHSDYHLCSPCVVRSRTVVQSTASVK